jgi:hypothetical protein
MTYFLSSSSMMLGQLGLEGLSWQSRVLIGEVLAQ